MDSAFDSRFAGRVCAREVAFDLDGPLAERRLHELAAAVGGRHDPRAAPIRLAVTRSGPDSVHCEAGVVVGLTEVERERVAPIFAFRRRRYERTSAFTTALVVPTGIGCEVGGHAGDATPAARLLAAISDRLITHPNVVNASDVNELPENGLYVEGSVLARVLMGAVALQPVRSNRVLVVLDHHPDPHFTAVAVNSVSAARASFGLDCPEVVLLDPPLPVEAGYAPSGRATGAVGELERLFAVLDSRHGTFDAVALSTRIAVPASFHADYYAAAGRMINPWGGVEALLTHAVSSLYDVPAAHSPMLESREVADLDLGLVDPRMAAEVISLGFFVSVLKGLRRSPRIVPLAGEPPAGMLAAEDVSCLVIPDGVVGLPTLAALEQGIPVVAVRENANVMANDLTALPWQAGRLHVVDNYWEACGVVAALRAGLEPASVRRPLAGTTVYAGPRTAALAV
jgi:hypothetical protein